MAAIGRDRGGEQLVVSLEHALGAFVSRPMQQLGRVHDIGKEQCYSAGVRHGFRLECNSAAPRTAG